MSVIDGTFNTLGLGFDVFKWRKRQVCSLFYFFQRKKKEKERKRKKKYVWLSIHGFVAFSDLWLRRWSLLKARAAGDSCDYRGGVSELCCECLKDCFHFAFFFFLTLFFFFLTLAHWNRSPGSDWHWQGILWQPLPQFLSRCGCLSCCVLFSRVHWRQ